MPTAYQPPRLRHGQAVRAVRAPRRGGGGFGPPRGRLAWVPLLGLLPVLAVAVAVLANGGAFGRGAGQAPVASGPTAVATAGVGSGVAQPAAAGGASAAGGSGAAADRSASTTGAAAQPSGSSGAAAAGTPTAAGTSGAAADRSPSSGGAAQPNGSNDGAAADRSASSGGAGVSGGAVVNSSGTGASTGSSIDGPTAAGDLGLAAGGVYRAYRVQAGDTVRFIASAYGVSAASIAQASGLTDPDHLRVGQVLTIPAQRGWLYRVQPGESLDQIAARTGVSTTLIASASQLTGGSVRAGDVILIPDTTARAVTAGK